MANRGMYPAQSNGLNKYYLDFELQGAGAAALTIPVIGSGLTWVTSIARSAAGTFVVTLKDPWGRIITKTADMDDTLNDGSYCTMGNITNEGTAVPLVFTLYTRSAAGTLADPASGRRIAVSLAIRNGVQLGGG